MGDEIGLLNDYSYKKNSVKAKDSRWLNRPMMDWDKVEKRRDFNTIEGRIYQGLRHLIKVRQSDSLLHSFALMQPLWTDNDRVFALARQRPERKVMILANFDAHWQSIDAGLLSVAGLVGNITNLLASETSLNISEERLYLAPYESLWLAEEEE